jgi:hypothetical protein
MMLTALVLAAMPMCGCFIGEFLGLGVDGAVALVVWQRHVGGVTVVHSFRCLGAYGVHVGSGEVVGAERGARVVGVAGHIVGEGEGGILWLVAAKEA